MGFDTNGVKLLINAKRLGVDFTKTVTIGRQTLNMSKPELSSLLQRDGYAEKDASMVINGGDFAENFLTSLGAKVTDSIDVSEYENATLLHDMNLPVDETYKEKYTAVIDGGSLEHIFNFPTAIKNCMEMVQKDGYFIALTPTNNYLGHGFYQFSPELFFRVLNENNGFKVIKIYFHTNKKDASIYEVADPLAVRSRVRMTNAAPSYLCVIAQRTEIKEIFKTTPQQSDYEHISWISPAEGPEQKPRRNIMQSPISIVRKWWTAIMTPIRKHRDTGISNPKYFKKVM